MKGRSKLRPFCVSETFGPTHSELIASPSPGIAVVPLLITLLVSLTVVRFVIVLVAKARIVTPVGMLVVAVMPRTEAVSVVAVSSAIV
jgi:hypothetical protein